MPDQYVKLPDGAWAKFPETMSDADIASALSGAQASGDGPVMEGAKEFVKTANPLPGVRTLGEAVMGAGEMMSGQIPQAAQRFRKLGGEVLAAHNKVKSEADDAWANGDTKTAVRKYIDWLIPFVGPAIDEQADNAAQGYVGKAVGGTLGLGLTMALPEMLKNASIRVPDVPVAPSLVKRTGNPVEAAAVALGEREGIPMDAGTVTGSPMVKNLQKRLEGTIGGAAPTQKFQAAKDAGLTRTGLKLADQVFPASATPETAGARVGEALESRKAAHTEWAQKFYGDIEKAAQQPANVKQVPIGTKRTPTGEMDAQGFPTYTETTVTEPMAFPVDQRAAKARLKPIYDELTQSMSVAQRQASTGYQALENIVNGRDFEPLLRTERNLGAIKALLRASEGKEIPHGLNAQAVQALQSAVDTTAAKGGPSIMRALKEGRAATVEKYLTDDLLERLKAEPVRTFDALTSRRDTSIGFLRDIQSRAPQVLPKVARAWLEDAIDTATQEGKFAHTDQLYANWQRLGDQTKQTLYGPSMTKNLDDFFMLAKKLGENPNPSGTANVLGMNATQAVLYLPSKVLAKMLYSPSGIKLLTEGVKLGLKPGGQAAASALIKQSARAAGVADALRAVTEAAQSNTTGVMPVGKDRSRQAGPPIQ